MKNDFTRAIGLELADIRRSKNISIIKVAEDTDINKDTICKYENSNSSMKIYIIYELLKYYKVDILYFFTKVYDRMQMNDNQE